MNASVGISARKHLGKMTISLPSLVFTLCVILHPSLATPIISPPTVLYGLPGQCAAVDANSSATDDLRSLLRDAVIPSLAGRRCSSPGFCAGYPAESCKSVAQETPDAPSGEYWIRTCSGSVVSVYCDMTTDRCCSNSGSARGWMRVANLNMTDPTQVCPAGMFLGADPRKRLCRRNVVAGCTSIFFPTYHFPYTRVCGRVRAYQEGTADAFLQYRGRTSLTVDDDFLDGVTISVGYPRTHIWSFAAANSEGGLGADSTSSCPCARTDVPSNGVIPPFVVNEYFCESGTSNIWAVPGVLYVDDALWDGEDCPENSSCCQLNNPPWFCRDLGSEFRNDFEVRLCGNEARRNEDFALEIIELYVQ